MSIAAQTGTGPYARIALLRPHDGHAAEFEAGYLRHLDWHMQAHDPWTWYGWSVFAGDRYRWFVWATFGHSAASLDSAVAPGDDERDNLLNVAPYVEWMTNGLYRFLPSLSRGTGEPSATPRVEFVVVDILPDRAREFEAAMANAKRGLRRETLWYQLIAGGATPRYVCLRPMAGFADLDSIQSQELLPPAVKRLTAHVTRELWTLRPPMTLGLDIPPR